MDRLRHNQAQPGNESIHAVLMGDLNLVRCFTGTGINTLSAITDPDSILFYSQECRRHRLIGSPWAEPDKAVADLIALGRELPDRPVLYYEGDATLLMISRNRDQLAPYYRFLMPPEEMVEDLVDKTRFARLAARFALPVPDTIQSRQASSAAEILQRIAPPLILKPDSRHHGWDDSALIQAEGGEPKKVLRANTADEFHRLYAGIRELTDDFVIQQYIPGGDDCIYSFHAYCNREAEPLAYFAGRKIRTWPRDSGLSTYLELVREPEVIRLGLEILRKMKFVGPVKIDFKKDSSTNRFYVLEFNARFTLWNHLGAVSGINLPLIAWADLTGQTVNPVRDYRTNIRWLSFGNDYRAFLRNYHADGDLSWAQWLWSLSSPKVYDVFAWRDPKPFLITALNQLKRTIRATGLRYGLDVARLRSAGGLRK
ncbi:MAG: hypothetical protein U0Z53_00550 [Blastocatellia bacterium]